MHPVLRRDMRQLMFNADKFYEDLEILVKDYTAWARDCQQSDLKKLMEHLKNIERDLSTILSDCEYLGRLYWKNRNLQVIDSLHRCCAIMDIVFSDLKRLKTSLSETYICPNDLRILIIDWCKFNKSILHAREATQHPQLRRKNKAWAHCSLFNA